MIHYIEQARSGRLTNGVEFILGEQLPHCSGVTATKRLVCSSNRHGLGSGALNGVAHYLPIGQYHPLSVPDGLQRLATGDHGLVEGGGIKL